LALAEEGQVTRGEQKKLHWYPQCIYMPNRKGRISRRGVAFEETHVGDLVRTIQVPWMLLLFFKGLYFIEETQKVLKLQLMNSRAFWWGF